MNIQNLLKDHSPGHDEIQIDSFMVIQNGGTIWGCYKQALRELATRVKSLRTLWIRSERMNCKVLETSDYLDRLEAEVELADLYENLTSLKKEAARIYLIADSLKSKIGDLTPEKVRELDEELWEHKIKSFIAQDLIDTGKISPKTREIVRALQAGLKERILAACHDSQALVDWYTDYEVEFPQIATIPDSVLKEIGRVSDPSESVERLSSY